MTDPLPLSVSDIHAHIRAAGGIVQGDGNIFFTNAEKFIAAAVLCGEPPFDIDRVRAEAMREQREKDAEACRQQASRWQQDKRAWYVAYECVAAIAQQEQEGTPCTKS